MTTSNSAEELYEKAEQAHDREDHATALPLYRQAAEKGDVWAMIRIGQMYYDGQGVTKDDGVGAHWIGKAAEAGGAETMFDVGYMYHWGEDLPMDYNEALRWFRKAAELGNANAMIDLGNMYENGKGVLQDYNEAIRWYRQAAEKGEFGARSIAIKCLVRLGAAQGE